MATADATMATTTIMPTTAAGKFESVKHYVYCTLQLCTYVTMDDQEELPFNFLNFLESWGSWAAWSDYSVTCNYNGTQQRIRACLNGECLGSNREVKYCSADTDCPGPAQGWILINNHPRKDSKSGI